MKTSTKGIKSYFTLTTLIIIIVLGFVITGLVVQNKALSSHITKLESENYAITTQLNSFDRSLCSNNYQIAQPNTLTKYTVQSAGYERSYQIHTPLNYDPTVRYPVILSFDGIEGSGDRMEAYSNLDLLPAIVVYLDALKGKQNFTAWQGAPYSVDGERDIQFVREILEILPSQYCTDSTKVFAVGMSNGGLFATIVGCEIGDQIKAVATMSGAFYSTCQDKERTPSLLVIHSTSDGQVPYFGSRTRNLPQLPIWAEAQAVERACLKPIPANEEKSVQSYTWLDCKDGSLLRLVVLQGQAHGWLTLPQKPEDGVKNSAGYIWKFFEEVTYSEQ